MRVALGYVVKILVFVAAWEAMRDTDDFERFVALALAIVVVEVITIGDRVRLIEKRGRDGAA